MKNRTDLADEGLEDLQGEGFEKEVKKEEELEIITVNVKTKAAANILKKPIGRYITIQKQDILEPQNFKEVEMVLRKEITPFLEGKEKILFVGLGNRDITPDRVGPDVADKIVATRHIDGRLKKILGYEDLRSVSVIAPGVLGQTGIETTEIVKACFKHVKPDLIIIVDALAAREFKRLGTTIQITDTGICPGSGVENKRKEISEKVLGVPVLVIGVPTVVDMKQLNSKKEDEAEFSMMVTPKNVDLIVKRAAKLISSSINNAIFNKMDKEDLEIFCEWKFIVYSNKN